MKKLLGILLSQLIAISCIGQLQETKAKIIDNLPKAPSSLVNRGSIPVVCGQDTAEYPRYKATQFVAIGFSGSNSVGQYYGAPQNVTISGFTFYAWMSDPIRTLKPKLYCKLYKAGPDSLPTGVALRSDTLTIDSTFGGGVLSVLEKHATFDSSITLNYPYVLVVENDDTAGCSIVTNSYNNGDGLGENLNCATVSGLWFNGRNLNIGGTTFDADIQLYPHVTYSYKNDFTIKDQCYRFGDSVHFKNDYKKTVVGSKYYNRYLYYNYDRFCFRWYNDASSFSSYSGVDGGAKYNTHANYDVRLISTLYHYRLGFGRCIDTTEKELNYKPIAPLPIGNKTVCNGDSLGLNIKQKQAEVYHWYSSYTDTLPEIVGDTYIQNPAIKNDTFYISATNKNCVSTRNLIRVQVNPYPTIDQIVDDSICSGANANLEIKVTDGIVKWFTSSIGGSQIASGNVLTTGPYTSDTAFYAQVSNGNCVLPSRTKVNVYVSNNFAPQEPIVSNDTTLCLLNAGTLSLTAKASGTDTLRWFNVASGGAPFHKGKTYMYAPSQREIKNFYIDAWNGVCGSSRVPMKVAINDYPTPTEIKDAEVCKGNDTFLSAKISYGTLLWFSDTLSSPAAIGSSNQITNAQKTDTFFIQTMDQGCIRPKYIPVELRVNNAPMISNIMNPEICAEKKATISLNINQGEIKWYEDSTKSSIQTGSPFATPVLYGNKTYYYQTNYKGCTSSFIKEEVIVNPKPAAGFTYSVAGKEVDFEGLLGSIFSYQWDFGDGKTGTNRTLKHTYANDAIYQVKLIVVDYKGCTDTAILEVNIGRIGIKKVNTFNAHIYPNPLNSNLLNISADKVIDQINVVDVTGKVVLSKAAVNATELSLSLELAPGNYYIIIKNKADYITVKKLLIN